MSLRRFLALLAVAASPCLAADSGNLSRDAVVEAELLRRQQCVGVEGDDCKGKPVLPVRDAPKARPGEPATMDSRYQLLHGGTEVLDRVTRLIWQRCLEGTVLAGERCAGVPVRGANSVSGLSQRESAWRTPTTRELATLVRYRPPAPQRQSVVDQAAFPDTPLDRFVAAGDRGGWSGDVDFGTGREMPTRGGDGYHRAVRDGPRGD